MRRQALKILGLDENADPQEIKRAYRAIISEVHPDSGKQSDYAYSAQEINAAYDYLNKHPVASSDVRKPGGNTRRNAENGSFNHFHDDYGKRYTNRDEGAETAGFQSRIWNAPENAQAYHSRDIMEHVTDEDGQVIGTIKIARGKFHWIPDEEFLLFLKSIMGCAKEVLEECDADRPDGQPPDNVYRYQAELVYLLAAQFMDAESLLRELSGEKEKNGIYFLQAMLEKSDTKKISEGASLYPSMLKSHRLYLKDDAGTTRGYLSFPDDRLYYALIPLFEQKAVQVRITTGKHVKQGSKVYQKLDLHLRFSGQMENLPENLNLKIGKLLEKYRYE